MNPAASSPWRQLRRAVGEAARDARRESTLAGWAAVAAFVLALGAPLVVTDAVGRSDMAAGLYVVLAAVGLNFAVGMAGMPSLGQGAFVAIGAFGVALLEVSAGWSPTAAVIVAVMTSTAAGIVVGAAAVRAEAVFVAIGTWIVAWLVAFALGAFPHLTGGSQGLPLSEAELGWSSLGLTVRLTPAVHYEVAVVLVAASLVAFALLRRGPFGVGLAAAGDHRGAAEALGVDPAALRLRAFAVSALLGGIAGALGVHLTAVADASSFGPLLSVELFIAVLLGGEGTVLGPIAGASVLVIVPRVASGVGQAAGVAPERFEPMVAAVLLVVAVVVGRGGVMRLASRAWKQRPRRLRTGDETPRPEAGSGGERVSQWPPALEAWKPALHTADGPLLVVERATKAFGGVIALDAVSIDLVPGRIRAVIGPNGSGKTTLLRALGGTLPLDSGTIRLDGTDVTGFGVRRRAQAGVVRTLQQVTSFHDLRVAENVEVGAVARRRHGGALRTAISTPLAREEARQIRDEVESLLTLAGLTGTEDQLPDRLSAADQRFLMLTSACASFPRVLLLDEPAAAMALPELRRLARVVETLRDRGVALLVVEHNLRFVRMVADVVTVLDAGRVIASGSVEQVASDPAVVEAYLGPARL